MRRAEDWPGFKILPKDWGKVLRIRRPKFFSKKMPELAIYSALPPVWMIEEWGLEGAKERMCELLAKEEERIALIMQLLGASSPGVGKFKAMFTASLAESDHLADVIETLPEERGTVNIVDIGETWAEGVYNGTGYIFGSFITGQWISVPIRARFRVFREGADHDLFDSNGKCVD